MRGRSRVATAPPAAVRGPAANRLLVATLTCVLALCVAAPARASTSHHRVAHPAAAVSALADQQPSTLRGVDHAAVLATATALVRTATWWSTSEVGATVSSRTADTSPARGPPGDAA